MKAVIAKSFERIHRSNLVGMGIVPLCFKPGEDAETLGLTGYERFSIDLPNSVSEIRPGQDVTVVTDHGKSFTCILRFDTEVWNKSSLSSLSLIFFFYCENLDAKIFPSAKVQAIFLQVELAYFDHGGILQYVIRNLIGIKH